MVSVGVAGVGLVQLHGRSVVELLDVGVGASGVGRARRKGWSESAPESVGLDGIAVGVGGFRWSWCGGRRFRSALGVSSVEVGAGVGHGRGQSRWGRPEPVLVRAGRPGRSSQWSRLASA